MTSRNELSQLDDLAFVALLKSKKKLKNWTVGEMLEADSRGKDFLSDDPGLKTSIQKVQSDLSKSVTEAMKPVIKDLGTQAEIAQKFAEQSQTIGLVVRKSLADQESIVKSINNAALLGSAASRIAINPAIIKLINGQAEANRKLISASQFAINPGIIKLIGAQSESYKNMISASQFAINPGIIKLIGAQSEAAGSLLAAANLGAAPAIDSFQKVSSALAATNSAAQALAESATRQSDTLENFSKSLTKTQMELKAELSPQLFNKNLGVSELDLVAKKSGASETLIVPLINRFERIRNAFISESTKELVENAPITNTFSEHPIEKMSKGAVSPIFVYIGIFGGIAAAIEGAILLLK